MKIIITINSIILLLVLFSCNGKEGKPMHEQNYSKKRIEMVNKQIIARGVKDTLVLNAMRTVPRHLFVPQSERPFAYTDKARSIGKGQTISQPYIVAFMTEELQLKPHHKVLEIGTGLGYQAAILGHIADSVYSIEIIEELADSARTIIKKLGYNNTVIKHGNGYLGWPEKAPFDAIIVTAAPPTVPPLLLEQLKIGGRMILPVGDYVQELVVISKSARGHSLESVLPVRFVPMTGQINKINEEN